MELVITKNENSRLEEKIIKGKGEQYSRRNNVELPGIPNSICDEDLEIPLLTSARSLE